MNRLQDRDGWRWYVDNADDLSSHYISVTKILEICVGEKLKNYFVNNSKAKQQKTLKAACDAGTAIHLIVENDLNGVVPVVPVEFQPIYESWLMLKDKHKIKKLHTELFVKHEDLGYAGTCDIIGEFDGKLCVMDLKTGNYTSKASWQMAAYKKAYERTYGAKDLGIVGIQIKRDGSAVNTFEVQHYDWVWDRFAACFEAFKGEYFGKLHKMNWKWLHVNSCHYYFKK